MSEQVKVNDRVTVNVADLIDRNKVSGLQTLKIILCGLVMYLDGFDIGTVSTTAPLLAEQVGVKVSTFGPVFSAGFVGVMLGSVFLGSLADRLGRKWMIVTSTFVFGFCTLITPLSHSFGVLVLLRFLTGVGNWRRIAQRSGNDIRVCSTALSLFSHDHNVHRRAAWRRQRSAAGSALC